MHTVHHSQAVIIKSVPSGEANRLVWLFTQNFGLIVATVQGIRNKGAKLQSHIIDYTFIDADLVRGRDVWRLVSARVHSDPLKGNFRNPTARAYVRTLGFIARFIIDEEPHDALYEHLRQCASLVGATIDAKAFDVLSIWKMLVILGYIAPSEEQAIYLDLTLKDAAENLTEQARAVLIREVQEAITQSHL
jgi:recombinational DNA repair protein (RecF pathway)